MNQKADTIYLPRKLLGSPQELDQKALTSRIVPTEFRNTEMQTCHRMGELSVSVRKS